MPRGPQPGCRAGLHLVWVGNPGDYVRRHKLMGSAQGGHIGRFGVIKTRGRTVPFHGPEPQKSEYAEG